MGKAKPKPGARKQKKCPDCKGSGRVLVKMPWGAKEEFTCDTCHGTGELKPAQNAEGSTQNG